MISSGSHKLYRAGVATAAYVAILNTFAIEFSLYWQVWYFDIIMHFLGGLWFGFLFLAYLHHTRRTRPLFWIIILVLGIGVAWELFEFVFGIQDVFSNEHICDTLLDLVMDTLGAVASYLIGRRLIRTSQS